MHKCYCNNVDFGTYANQIWVHAPAHMPKSNGYCLDRCIAEEIMALWMLGITTTGCCCGHNTDAAFIGVDFGDIQRMKEMGYVPIHNPHRPGDEDSFSPMGAKHAGTILLKSLGMDTAPLKQKDNEPQDIRRENLTLHIQNHQLREQIARQEEQIKTLLVQLAEKGGRENEEGEQSNKHQ